MRSRLLVKCDCSLQRDPRIQFTLADRVGQIVKRYHSQNSVDIQKVKATDDVPIKGYKTNLLALNPFWLGCW
jgi:hypothetical protein